MSEIHDPIVTFSIRWDDDHHIEASLPASVTARVLEAVMRPASIINFDRNLSPEEAGRIREAFRRTGRAS